MRSVVGVVSIIVACSSLGGVSLWVVLGNACRCHTHCSIDSVPKIDGRFAGSGVGRLAKLPLSVRNVTRDTLTMRDRININWRWIQYYHGRR